jgi:hypothetical protein
MSGKLLLTDVEVSISPVSIAVAGWEGLDVLMACPAFAQEICVGMNDNLVCRCFGYRQTFGRTFSGRTERIWRITRRTGYSEPAGMAVRTALCTLRRQLNVERKWRSFGWQSQLSMHGLWFQQPAPSLAAQSSPGGVILLPHSPAQVTAGSSG